MQQPIDEQVLDEAAWRDVVARLGDHLAGQWPAMPERLGERYGAFIDLAVQQGLQRGLTEVAGLARYANLWFVWGPAFQDKPGFQWAQEILARAATHPALAVHQLVQRSLVELGRMPGARIEPAMLDVADERVCQVFGPLGRRGALARPGRRLDPLPVAPARRHCDLEAAELRVLEGSGASPGQALPLQRYEFDTGGGWQRVPVAAPAPLRITLGQACPPALGLLSLSGGQGPATRLQARLRMAHVCDGDVHPAVDFDGPHGRWHWAGHEAKSFNWPIATREQDPPPAGAGTVLAEETAPELHRLTLDSCALREQGDALGVQQATVSAWPAEQWLLDLQRSPAESQALLPPGRPVQRGSTRCRLECDGQAQDAQALTAQFEQGLDGAIAQALSRLTDAWAGLADLAQPRCEAQLGLLCGRAACTWGWQLTALDVPAHLRVVAALDLAAGQVALELGGVWQVRGSSSRISLKTVGLAELKQTFKREQALPDVTTVLLPAVARWRWPLTLELEPQAGESLALAQQQAPVTGALVGEAGLRPCTHGRSGWEWFARLDLEPVIARVAVSDPLLGHSVSTHTLLPALSLVDWSMG